MQVIEAKNLKWIDIKNPTEKDIKWLKDNFNLHPLVLKEILPPLDNPKLENFGEYIFIVLFYPFFSRPTFQTIPFELDIIVAKNYIITVHYKDIVPLKAIFDKFNLYEDIREKYSDQGTGEVLYRIIQELLSACFPKLGHIKENIDRIEKDIYSQKYKKSVYNISLIKRDIIGFQRVMEPQEIVLTSLSEVSEKFFGKDLVPYFHNLVGLYNQVEKILETRFKTLTALDSTNQSLLETKTNEIIKLLTIFSVIVFPLSLFAGIFGMNTKYLPFVGSPYDFWIISGIMTGAAILMLVFFKIKKWF
ncbi:magnesium transporter CorA family protein [bacterium]|nr:magnesium transporter CorA family protein [bacterium]